VCIFTSFASVLIIIRSCAIVRRVIVIVDFMLCKLLCFLQFVCLVALILAFAIDRKPVSLLHWYLILFLFCCNCVFEYGVIIL
jgi:hypothetical protein